MPTTFNYNAVGGKIKKTGFTYSVTTGVWEIAYDQVTGSETRAYWQYLTDIIGAGSTVTLAEYKYEANAGQPTPQANNAYTKFGSWIGAALGSADWAGGTDMNIDPFFYGDATWFDLSVGGVDATALVSKTGTTDLAFWIHEAATSGYSYEGLKEKSQLRVTWTASSALNLRTLVGTGLEFLGCVLVQGAMHYKYRQIFDPVGV